MPKYDVVATEIKKLVTQLSEQIAKHNALAKAQQEAVQQADVKGLKSGEITPIKSLRRSQMVLADEFPYERYLSPEMRGQFDGYVDPEVAWPKVPVKELPTGLPKGWESRAEGSYPTSLSIADYPFGRLVRSNADTEAFVVPKGTDDRELLRMLLNQFGRY